MEMLEESGLNLPYWNVLSLVIPKIPGSEMPKELVKNVNS